MRRRQNTNPMYFVVFQFLSVALSAGQVFVLGPFSRRWFGLTCLTGQLSVVRRDMMTWCCRGCFPFKQKDVLG